MITQRADTYRPILDKDTSLNLSPRDGRRFLHVGNETREFQQIMDILPFEVVVLHPYDRGEHSSHGDFCENDLVARWYYFWKENDGVVYRFESDQDAIKFKLRFG